MMRTHLGGALGPSHAGQDVAVCGWVASRRDHGGVVFLDLREAGETCSQHRVARLMRQANLRALHGYRTRRWAVGTPSVLIPNLLQRQFPTTQPNKAWVTDITDVRTWPGWLYLAVVIDLYSRKVVGWAMECYEKGMLTKEECDGLELKFGNYRTN